MEVRRLDDVVVAAKVETGQPVGHTVGRRQEHHRDIAAPADLAADFESGHAREPDVEDHQIELLAVERLQRGLRRPLGPSAEAVLV